MFRDREDAAHQLADKLKDRDLLDPLILAIPRGGVVTGAVLASELGAELDVVLSRKLQAPASQSSRSVRSPKMDKSTSTTMRRDSSIRSKSISLQNPDTNSPRSPGDRNSFEGEDAQQVLRGDQ